MGLPDATALSASVAAAPGGDQVSNTAPSTAASTVSTIDQSQAGMVGNRISLITALPNKGNA